MINDKDYKSRFEVLYQLLARTHLCFYVWKGLQKKEYEVLFAKNSNFWSAVLFSLLEGWLQSLANTYEESKYSKQNEVISVYSLIENQKDMVRKLGAEKIVNQNQAIIKNISILRHHQLSHYNVKHLLTPKVILKKFPIEYAKVEKLLGITGELLHCLCPDNDHGFSFDSLNEMSEVDSESIMTCIKYYLEQEKKFYDWAKNNPKKFCESGQSYFYETDK